MSLRSRPTCERTPRSEGPLRATRGRHPARQESRPPTSSPRPARRSLDQDRQRQNRAIVVAFRPCSDLRARCAHPRRCPRHAAVRFSLSKLGSSIVPKQPTAPALSTAELARPQVRSVGRSPAAPDDSSAAERRPAGSSAIVFASSRRPSRRIVAPALDGSGGSGCVASASASRRISGERVRPARWP